MHHNLHGIVAEDSEKLFCWFRICITLNSQIMDDNKVRLAATRYQEIGLNAV